MKNGNQPIYPSQNWAQKGLTKREYFAAMAMQGLIANSRLDAEKAVSIGTANTIAWDAVKCADALLSELDKTEMK